MCIQRTVPPNYLTCKYCGITGENVVEFLRDGQRIHVCRDEDFKVCVERMTQKIIEDNLKKAVTNNGN